MRRTGIAVMAVASFAAVLWMTGCGDDKSTRSMTGDPLVRTIPADGATGVDPAQPIRMAFNEAVDTADFHRMFNCVEGTMHDAVTDSLTHGMDCQCDHMLDSTGFYERMHDRGVRGQFHWNQAMDSCDFVPDSPLGHGMEYAMHFRSGMRNHSGGMMRHMGEMFNEDMVMRFRTHQP